MYPKPLEDLIYNLQKLPGVGTKTAERYAFAILNFDPETKEEWKKALKNISQIKHCKECGNLTDHDVCSICENPNRNHKLICVVSQPKDIIALENMNSYDGVYHVLNGVINTAKGILPSDLNIDSLIKRINENTEEVIIALDPTLEGETTNLYLEKLLGNHVKITKLAYGIPVGSHLDYADTRTLTKAFEGRK